MRRTLYRDITVIGASAGGVAAPRALLAALPADYPAAMFIVLHMAPDAPSVLRQILNRAKKLPVSVAASGARIRPATVTLAAPDLHLAFEGNRVRSAHGPRENRNRPSIDVLFRSAPVTFGPRVTGVLLSGMLDDGAAREDDGSCERSSLVIRRCKRRRVPSKAGARRNFAPLDIRLGVRGRGVDCAGAALLLKIERFCQPRPLPPQS